MLRTFLHCVYPHRKANVVWAATYESSDIVINNEMQNFNLGHPEAAKTKASGKPGSRY